MAWNLRFRFAQPYIAVNITKNGEAAIQGNNIIHTVSCHAEGKVGDVAPAGVPAPPGNAMDPINPWPGGYRISDTWPPTIL